MPGGLGSNASRSDGTRRQWLEQNRGRLFFSDFGGYKFYVAPEGYPGVPAAEPTSEAFWFPR